MLVVIEVDSCIFILMMECKVDIIVVNFEDFYYSQVYVVCQVIVEKLIEYSSLELLEEVCEKMKEYYLDKVDEFCYVLEMVYVKVYCDGKIYVCVVCFYVKEIFVKDVVKFNDFVLCVFNDFDNDKNVFEVVQYVVIEVVCYNGDIFCYYYMFVIVEKKLGNIKQFLVVVCKVFELVEQDMFNVVCMFIVFIDMLECEG